MWGAAFKDALIILPEKLQPDSIGAVHYYNLSTRAEVLSFEKALLFTKPFIHTQ